jgi:uncharacterized cupin superfamily protein
MSKPIINIDEIALEPPPAAFAPAGPATERYQRRTGMIAPRIGARLLGYNITAVPPGKRAFPAHNHRVNEEMFFILEGTGEVRVGTNTFPIRAGDFIACPPGGKETAHQILNTGAVELRYLAVSTKLSPEIAEYPDSNKFGVLAVFEPDAAGNPQRFVFVGREGQQVPYWDGE